MHVLAVGVALEQRIASEIWPSPYDEYVFAEVSGSSAVQGGMDRQDRLLDLFHLGECLGVGLWFRV